MLVITLGYTTEFLQIKKQAVGHNPSIKLMTHLDIKAMEIGFINLIFPHGKAMKLGDHCHEENTQLEDDYDVMIGTNIQTITPTGWVHEQNNKKVITANQAVLAKEIGIARYERIKDFDWQVGFDYWAETSDYWKRVRNVINNKLDNSSTFKLRPPQNAEPLWSKLFMMADQHINGEIIQDNDIEEVINNYSLNN